MSRAPTGRRHRPAGPPPRSSAPRAGFTLIEILVAMVVFLAGIAGLYALLSTGLSMQQDGLELSRSGRRVEDVAQLLQRELSADRLRGDVLAEQLGDGSWYRATLLGLPEGGEGVLPVEIRVAGSERGLDLAAPELRLLRLGPSMAQAVRGWRARRLSEKRTAPPSTLESR